MSTTRKLLVSLMITLLLGLQPDGRGGATSPYWMSFYGTVYLNGRALSGASVTAYVDGRENGSAVSRANGEYGYLAVYGDDPSTAEKDGAVAGDLVVFKVNGIRAAEATWTEHGARARVNLYLKAGVYLPLLVRSTGGTPIPTSTPTRTNTPTPTETATSTDTPTPTNTPSDRSIVAPRSSPAPSIDGDLGEWSGVAGTLLDAPHAEARGGWETNPSTYDLSLTLRTAWDPGHLYVSAVIADDVLVGRNSPNIWEDDTLELGIQLGGRTRQFSLGVDGRVQVLEDGSPRAQPDIIVAIKQAPGGWQLEASIPASALGVGTLAAFEQPQFTFGYWDDDDGGGGDSHLIRWGASTNSGAVYWGSVLLSPATLTPGTPTPTPQPPLRTSLPASWFRLPPVIDGSIEDWSMVQTALLDDARAETHGGSEPHPSATDLSVSLHAGWDAAYLYFAVTVQDDVRIGNESANIWQDDSLELGIQIGGRVRQLTFAVDGRYGSLLEGWEQTTPLLTRQVRTTPDGWTVEVAIPASTLGVAEFSAGANYPFTFGYWDDDDGGGGDTHLILWGTSTNSSPGGWKPLTLTTSQGR